MRILACSIDLSKIDKSKIVEGKNGAKYYDFDVTVNDEKNQYGQDVSISQKQTKEERTNKVKKVFIGNGKTVFQKEPNAIVTDDKPETYTTRNGIETPDDSDIPF